MDGRWTAKKIEIQAVTVSCILPTEEIKNDPLLKYRNTKLELKGVVLKQSTVTISIVLMLNVLKRKDFTESTIENRDEQRTNRDERQRI